MIPSGKFQEAGKFVPTSQFFDDALLLGKDPGKISKIGFYVKTFITGIQITYADGSSTGPHCGFLEPEVPPKYAELKLEANEYIVLIAGYASDYIGAIHITTTLGKTLDVGQNPAGNSFKLGGKGNIIPSLKCGILGHLSYLYAVIVPYPLSSVPAPTFSPVLLPSSPEKNLYPALDDFSSPYNPMAKPQPYTLPQEHQQPYPFPQPVYQPPLYPRPIPPPISFPNVEYTHLYGKENPKGIAFNDFETIVKPAFMSGCKVRISRVKVYEDSTGILGIKAVYEITPPTGKVEKKLEWHKSPKVGFFTKCKGYNFPPGSYISYIQGKHYLAINKLTFIDNSKNVVLDAGKNEGGEFCIVPDRRGPIIAFAGSVNEEFYTLRCYATY